MVEHVIMKWREQYQLVSMILSINPLHFTFASHAIIFADDATMQIITSCKLCQISALQETEQLMPTCRQLDSWSEHWNPVSKLRKLWKRESGTSGWTIMTCKPGWILLRSVAKIQPKFNLWWKYVKVGTPKVLLKCIRWEGFVEDSLRESVFFTQCSIIIRRLESASWWRFVGPALCLEIQRCLCGVGGERLMSQGFSSGALGEIEKSEQLKFSGWNTNLPGPKVPQTNGDFFFLQHPNGRSMRGVSRDNLVPGSEWERLKMYCFQRLQELWEASGNEMTIVGVYRRAVFSTF